LVTLGADRAVRIWDVQSGRLLRAITHVHDRTSAAVAWGEGVAFVGNTRVAVAPWSLGKGTPSPVVARVFDLPTANPGGEVDDPAGATQPDDIDVSPDGKLLVAGHARGPLQLYRLSDGRRLDVVQGSAAGAVPDVEFSRDGKFVATGGVDGFAKIWSVAD